MSRIVVGITISHDHAFAPANRNDDQENDGYRCQPQMEQQLVGLVARGRAVIARDLYVDVLGHGAMAHQLKLLDEPRRDIDRIGARPLGDGDGDGRNADQFAVRVLA